MEADERTVKAAIYGPNRAGGRTRELEEPWIIHALVREDGMSQVEVAELLGRHKSWVCRRLALIERLGAKEGIATSSPIYLKFCPIIRRHSSSWRNGADPPSKNETRYAKGG
jgi:hypothetical protein